MHDVVVMQEGHTLQQHHHVALNLGRAQRSLVVPDDFGQVRQHKVKDQDEACPMRKDILQLHDLKSPDREHRKASLVCLIKLFLV